MAIQKAITLNSGIVLASAYHKVIKVNISKEINKSEVAFFLQIFKDFGARNDEKGPVMLLEHRVGNHYPNNDFDAFFDISVLNAVDVNAIKQCYEWLKTQDVGGINYTENVTDV